MDNPLAREDAGIDPSEISGRFLTSIGAAAHSHIHIFPELYFPNHIGSSDSRDRG